MFTVFSWAMTVVCIIGVILNAQKKISGFYFWIVANIGFAVINWYTESYALMVLFIFYFIMCFYGIYLWKRNVKD